MLQVGISDLFNRGPYDVKWCLIYQDLPSVSYISVVFYRMLSKSVFSFISFNFLSFVFECLGSSAEHYVKKLCTQSVKLGFRYFAIFVI